MSITVVETEVYAEAADELLTPKEREAIRLFLAANPEVGDVVPGLQGMRKLRWTEVRRNKGKRGGTRHIYFYAVTAEIVFLLDAYPKGVREDLSNAHRKQLKEALDILKAAEFERRGSDG